MAEQQNLPRKIGKGVRVREKKKNGRIGTIIAAVGKKQWTVKFDGERETETKTSSHLSINKESYVFAQQNSPLFKNALATIQKAARSTVKKRRKIDSNSDEKSSSDNSSGSGSGGSSSDSSGSGSNDYDGSVAATPKNRRTMSSLISSTVSKLLTPRPIAPSAGRRLFHDQMPREDVFIPEEGEGFDDENEEEEDDNCRGTESVFTDGEGERKEFIDQPQKQELYEKAKSKMEKEKARLIAKETVFEVEVKSQNAYTFGGRVVGKTKQFAGKHGTIVEVITDGMLYKVEWDDGTSCDMENRDLKLSKERPRVLEWRVVEDHVPENPPTEYPPSDTGVIGFSFTKFNNLDRESDDYDHPFARLLELLWPKDKDGNGWREHLKNANVEIQRSNAEGGSRKMKECDEDEWWTFWGIVIYAAKVGKGGVENLYDKTPNIFHRLPNTNIDLTEIMKKYRFQQLLKVIPFAFHGSDEADPWNPVMALIDGFNDVRAQKIAAAMCKVFDESMSAWSPTTTRWGGLPFLSFILRKPTPLGTEFKVVACSSTGMLLHLELQRGKLPMRAKKYSKQLGGTAGCSVRLAEATQYCGSSENKARRQAKEVKKRELYYGDSWFSSRRLALFLKKKFGHEYFGALKTNHSGTPKDQLVEIMKDWPAGSYLTVVCEEANLFIVAYKYSYKKPTVCFIGTWDAGSTKQGKPYISKFPDEWGNIKYREVPRPDCIGKYFANSNVIDVHNQILQNELGLERCWKTKDPWFRIDCTVLGMCVTDSFLAAKHSAAPASGICNMSIKDFALNTAVDLWTRKVSEEPRVNIAGPNTSYSNCAADNEMGQEVTLESHAEVTRIEIARNHLCGPTTQRDNSGHPCRRACQMKADDNCRMSGVTQECQHPACKAKVNSGTNRFGATKGVFICRNTACQSQHWDQVYAQSQLA